MLTTNINFKNFYLKKISKNIKEDLKKLLKEKNMILESLSSSYQNSYSKREAASKHGHFTTRESGIPE